jgi:hypothetical protein
MPVPFLRLSMKVVSALSMLSGWMGLDRSVTI